MEADSEDQSMSAGAFEAPREKYTTVPFGTRCTACRLITVSYVLGRDVTRPMAWPSTGTPGGTAAIAVVAVARWAAFALGEPAHKPPAKASANAPVTHVERTAIPLKLVSIVLLHRNHTAYAGVASVLALHSGRGLLHG